MIWQKKFNEDALFLFPLVDAGTLDFVSGPTIAAGDAKLFSDAQISTNIAAESVAFTSGSEEPANGDTIDGATSAASGTFMFAVVTSGTWGGGDAAGFIFMKSLSGAFQAENLNINGGTANVMTIGADFTAGLFVSLGNGGYALAATAAEMSCGQGSIHIVDSATKEWEDQALLFETFGHASAAKQVDFNDAMRGTDSAGTAANLATVDTVVDAIKAITDALPNAGALSDLATLLARLTSARAGYLDKLNISGNVAASGEVTAIQNNTRVRVIIPQTLERPDSGSTLYQLDLYIYDTDGNMEAPDSLPTITAQNEAGTDRSSNLGTVTLVSTGVYKVTYTVASGHLIEQIRFEWSIVEGGVTKKHGASSQIVDTTAVDFTAADRTKLDTLHDTRCTETRMAELDPANLPTDIANVQSDTDDIQSRLPAILVGGRMDSDVGGKTGNVALSTQEKADVNAEVDQALQDIHLDHLLAVDTPTPLPGVAGSILNDLLEDDGGLWRFIANALEEGPGGGAGVTVNSLTVAALKQFMTVDSGETAGVAGSVAKIAQGAAGGNVTVEDLTAAALVKVVDAVLDEARADHDAAGSVGEGLNDCRADARNKKRSNKDTGATKTYKDDGTTVRYTQTVQKVSDAVVELAPS